MAEENRREVKFRNKNLKNAFVTVGTTEFDTLISTITTWELLKVLEQRGFTSLTLQTGRGSVEPPTGVIGQIKVDTFHYKPSLQADIAASSLVISHAGAGSCLETLGAGKPLLVVINKELMDNHQLELAQQLHQDGHIYYCDCGSLGKTLTEMDIDNLKPFKPGDATKLGSFLDSKMGFS